MGIYPKDAQSYHKGMCSTMFIAALFVIARTQKQPKCPPTEEWIRKMWYIYTMEYNTAEKNNDSSNFAEKYMELENIILSEVNPASERQKSYVLTHKWLLDIKQRKKTAYNSQSQRT